MTDKLRKTLAFLDERFPLSRCSLNYGKDYELLIAVMLSAQTSDKAVNEATADLFADFPTLSDIADADVTDIERDVARLGLGPTKARRVKAIAAALLERFNGAVPKDRDLLVTLPGVGIKTANCVLAELYGKPLLAVDTHVQRIARRIGLARTKDDVIAIERKLEKGIPPERLIRANHQLIDFGRAICKAQHPLCEICPLREICGDYRKRMRASKSRVPRRSAGNRGAAGRSA